MITNELTDNELALAFQAGNLTAYNRLYTKYFPILIHEADRIVHDLQTAQDLAQDSLLKIYRALIKKTFEAKAQFFTWATRILRNTITDYFRGLKRKILSGDATEDHACDYVPNPEASTHYSFLRAWFKEQCLQMGPNRGKILYLAAVYHFSMEEIAIEMGNSKGSVKSELSKARAHMRRQVPYYKNLAY